MSQKGGSTRDQRRTAFGYLRLPALLRDRYRRADLVSRIPAVTSWVEVSDVPPTPVSVIIATRDRPHLLPRAVATVQAQRHPAVEIVVVDNSSKSQPRADLSQFADANLKVVRMRGRGLSAARNRGLEAATGELVTYLDDDNYMHPLWCKAVAWAFMHFPAPELMYGARLCEDYARLGDELSDAPTRYYYPFFHLEPFSRRGLERRNYIDANVMAHRRDHPQAWFDETLPALSDWDLALRLTRDRAGIPLPVLACHYTTREDTRLSRDRALVCESDDQIRRQIASADDRNRRGLRLPRQSASGGQGVLDSRR